MEIELREVTAENLPGLLAIRIPAGQARFVGGQIQDVMADADKFPEANPWSRAVHLAGDVVGFVMISWDVEPDPPAERG